MFLGFSTTSRRYFPVGPGGLTKVDVRAPSEDYEVLDITVRIQNVVFYDGSTTIICGLIVYALRKDRKSWNYVLRLALEFISLIILLLFL